MAHTAFAHPLGMASINRYAGIRINDKDIEVDYLLDFAELPALKEIESLDADHNGFIIKSEQNRYLDSLLPKLFPNLSLEANGAPVVLKDIFRGLTMPPGESGMNTLRIAVEFRGVRPPGDGDISVVFKDASYEDRAGWREISALDTPVAAVVSPSPENRPRAGAGLAYPNDATKSPLRENVASFVFRPGATPAARPRPKVENKVSDPLVSDGARLADLVRNPERSAAFLLFAFALAFVLGAGHALTPGHGKTLVAAYLIGEKSRVRDALILGATVTVTHTASVFAMGLLALFIERSIGTDRVLRALEIGSGLLVVAIAMGQMPARIRRWRAGHDGGHHDPHDHKADHEHDGIPHHHGDGHYHTHLPAEQSGGKRALITLGISGGILPCPGALVVLLTAISLHRLALGIGLLTAFSLGLATTLSTLGVLFVMAKQRLDRFGFDGRAARVLPVFSSLVVLALGVGIVLRGFLH